MASICRKNMHGYLSADITFPVMPFEDQIMFKDKYASIILRQIEAFVFIFLQIFQSTRGKIVYEQLTVYGFGCSLFSVIWYDFTNKNNIYSSFCIATQCSLILN